MLLGVVSHIPLVYDSALYMTPSSLFDLSGRIVLVVGGAGYLGQPICHELAKLGATVLIADNRLEAAESAALQLRSQNLEVKALQLDLGDEAAITRTIQSIRRQHGRLDVAINATSYSTGIAMADMTVADFEKGLRITLVGAFVFARESAKVMLEQGKGSIIQFGSMYGLVSPDPSIYAPNFNVNPVDYGAGKAGLLQMVRYQAVMWGPQGVRVNAVVPGPFPNPTGQGKNIDFVKKLSQKVPLGRIGRAEEIAGAVAFLASDASSFVTGTQLIVDGGWTAW